jgi:hypothetical protein
MVYRFTLPTRPGWCIAYWEAINIYVAFQVFSPYFRGQALIVWSDSQVSVHVLHSGRGSDLVLHYIACNIWLLQVAFDCDLEFRHIPGRYNTIADL